MNYSQRKHLERLMELKNDFDPFGLSMPGTFFGMKVVPSIDHPRYKLPTEVMPGVPWPPGFREDFNKWSVNFLGTTNVLPRGSAFILSDRYVVMHPRDVVMLTNL